LLIDSPSFHRLDFTFRFTFTFTDFTELVGNFTTSTVNNSETLRDRSFDPCKSEEIGIKELPIMNERGGLADYTIEREIGRGTMGAVYLARTLPPEMLEVAIKRVPTFGTAEDRERLRREAETMAQLDHPNVMAVLDVLDDGEGIALVMPYAKNGNLTKRLALGLLSPESTTNVILPICEALASAHDKGILHRDVKPSNIVFSVDDVPLLADFGIARNAMQANLTRTDLAIGTAGYLDPDQADGAQPGPLADQYALGVVAYECLTGASPFAATTPMGVLRNADKGVFPALDRTTIGPMAEVIERSFSRNPNDRFSTMWEFLSALRDPATYVATLPAQTFMGSQDPSNDLERDEFAADATRTFSRQSRTLQLNEATPVKPSRKRTLRATAVGVGLFLAAGGGFGAIKANSAKNLRNLGVPTLPECNTQSTTQCVNTVVKTNSGIDITFASGTKTSYLVGAPNDALRVGNWFCGERATLALYRPNTGVIYFFNTWPTGDGVVDLARPLEAVADQTGIQSAQVGVGDTNHDGCADIALDVDGKRTWFAPNAQTKRLVRAPLALTLIANTGAAQ
jgi:serine/threonine protein kinase